MIAAGSATPRTIVASISTAAASPTPSCLNSSSPSVANTAKMTTITSAALVTAPPVAATPSAAASRARESGATRLVHPFEHEHRVVHRQAEQDYEQEQREPGDDRTISCEAEQRLRPVVLEDGDEHAVGGTDRQQVQADDRRRELGRAERGQQQHESERHHQPDHQRGHILHLIGEVETAGGVARHECVAPVGDGRAQSLDDALGVVQTPIGHRDADHGGPAISRDVDIDAAMSTGDPQRPLPDAGQAALLPGAAEVLAVEHQRRDVRRTREGVVDRLIRHSDRGVGRQV